MTRVRAVREDVGRWDVMQKESKNNSLTSTFIRLYVFTYNIVQPFLLIQQSASLQSTIRSC